MPVTAALIPLLVTFSDPGDPLAATEVPPNDPEAAFGNEFHLLDFGGSLGEPLTRGVEAELPPLKPVDASAAVALRACLAARGSTPEKPSRGSSRNRGGVRFLQGCDVRDEGLAC